MTKGLSFGDIVLVEFPYDDHLGKKTRPAVVISSPAHATSLPRSLIIQMITSQVRYRGSFGIVAVSEWQQSGLDKESVIRPVIQTIETSRVTKHIGHLRKEAKKELKRKLFSVLGP